MLMINGPIIMIVSSVIQHSKSCFTAIPILLMILPILLFSALVNYE